MGPLLSLHLLNHHHGDHNHKIKTSEWGNSESLFITYRSKMVRVLSFICYPQNRQSQSDVRSLTFNVLLCLGSQYHSILSHGQTARNVQLLVSADVSKAENLPQVCAPSDVCCIFLRSSSSHPGLFMVSLILTVACFFYLLHHHFL